MTEKRIKYAKKILDFMIVVKPSHKIYVTKVAKLYTDSKIERLSDAKV